MRKIVAIDEGGVYFEDPVRAMVSVINKAIRDGLGVPDNKLLELQILTDTKAIRFYSETLNLYFDTYKFVDNFIVTEFGRKFANIYKTPYDSWGAYTYLMGDTGNYCTIRNEAMGGITIINLGTVTGEDVIINITGWGVLGDTNTKASLIAQSKGALQISHVTKSDDGVDWPSNTNVIYRSLFTPNTTIVDSANKDGYVLVPYKPSNTSFKSSGNILVGCGNYLALSSGYVSIGGHGMAVIPDPQLGSKLVSDTYLFMEDRL